MPEIENIYKIQNISAENVYLECLKVLKELKVQDVVEAEISNMPFSKNVTAVVPSIWGWGGMKFSLMVEQQDIVNLKLNGYIAQLATGPLRKVMDNFLEKLSVSLKNNYQYNFEYQKTSGLVPKSKAKLNKKDTTIIVIMLVVTLFSTLVGSLFGRVYELTITSLILGFGYYFGRKMLKKPDSPIDSS